MDLLIAAIGNTVYPESDEDLFGPSVAYDENQDDPYPLPNATTSTTAPHSNQDHFHNGLKACGKGHQYSVPCARYAQMILAKQNTLFESLHPSFECLPCT